MARRTARRGGGNGAAPHALELSPAAAYAMRAELPAVADRTVAAIIDEVPSYADALSGPMGETIRSAVQLALGTFLNLATRSDRGTPMAPALEGAYQLGRGEARSGRSMEALLAAYRIGARVSWRDMSRTVVEQGMEAEQLSSFAELVFAYIDELSAASAAGHTEELERTGRVRSRNLERLARALLTDQPADAVVASAERAGWEPPAALTAVLLPEAHVRKVISAVDERTLAPTEDVPGAVEGTGLLLVAGPTTKAARSRLLGALKDLDAVVGPTVPWLEVATSYERALQCRRLELTGTVDSEEHLAEIVITADRNALADLRAAVLAPLSGLRPSAVEKLTETLRSWLLHHGRREDIAADLFVHPQTVRYRVGQLREAYGDRLDDPRFVLEATIALGVS
jgi:DNA-binding PucR family transcriptional regulator